MQGYAAGDDETQERFPGGKNAIYSLQKHREPSPAATAEGDLCESDASTAELMTQDHFNDCVCLCLTSWQNVAQETE
jgi:hypothetical protein